MEKVVIIVLAVLLLAAVVKIILYRKNLKALTGEFEMLIREEGNGELHLGSPSSGVEKFLRVFNRYLEKVMENQYEEKKKEEKLKEEIANISHDLRTPLTSMKGYLRLLEETESEVERSQYLNVVWRKTGQLQQLVEQLYEYTSLKGREQKLSMERTELYGFFCNQILNFYHDFEEKQIQVQLPQEKHFEIMADRQALERIFGNLIGNALKYGRDYWKITLEESDDAVKMVFCNPAGGLKEKEVEHLFERFYMKEQSRTVGGSGLGLTITKMLVESMDGEMSAVVEDACLKLTIRFPKMP